MKKGLPVKYISTKDIFSLPVDDQLIGAEGFYRKHKGFYLIPNDYQGKIISFVVRGLSHDYHDIFGVSNTRPLFGWYTFVSYKKGYPIIVTEGVKDCIVLQSCYPFTLALLTAGITSFTVQVLKSMTNKVILAYDKDKTGSNSTTEDIKLLQKNNFQVQTITPDLKDFGADYQDSVHIKQKVVHKLKNFSRLGALL